MILERCCGWSLGKGKEEDSDGVTQQVKWLVPVGSEGLFDAAGLTEV
jgi:hypothetical protein